MVERRFQGPRCRMKTELLKLIVIILSLSFNLDWGFKAKVCLGLSLPKLLSASASAPKDSGLAELEVASFATASVTSMWWLGPCDAFAGAIIFGDVCWHGWINSENISYDGYLGCNSKRIPWTVFEYWIQVQPFFGLLSTIKRVQWRHRRS